MSKPSLGRDSNGRSDKSDKQTTMRLFVKESPSSSGCPRLIEFTVPRHPFHFLSQIRQSADSTSDVGLRIVVAPLSVANAQIHANRILLIGNPFQARRIDLQFFCDTQKFHLAIHQVRDFAPSDHRNEPTMKFHSDRPIAARHFYSYRVLGENKTRCVDYSGSILCVIPDGILDHSKGHHRIPLSFEAIKLHLQSVDGMVSKHLHYEEEQVAHIFWSLDVRRMRATVLCWVAAVDGDHA